MLPSRNNGGGKNTQNDLIIEGQSTKMVKSTQIIAAMLDSSLTWKEIILYINYLEHFKGFEGHDQYIEP